MVSACSETNKIKVVWVLHLVVWGSTSTCYWTSLSLGSNKREVFICCHLLLHCVVCGCGVCGGWHCGGPGASLIVCMCFSMLQTSCWVHIQTTTCLLFRVSPSAVQPDGRHWAQCNAGVIGYDDLARESLCCYHDNYTQLSGNSPVSPPDIMSDVVWRDYQYLFYTCPHVVRWQREPFLRELAGIGLLQQLMHALNILCAKYHGMGLNCVQCLL